MPYVVQEDECPHESIGLVPCKNWKREYEVIELDETGEYVEKIVCCLSQDNAYELAGKLKREEE